MTREEIAIKVATEIWGETNIPESFWSCNIEDRVFSWQGFGKTVEAMAENDNVIIDEVGKHFIDYLLGRISKEQLWGRAHLAALEAMNENT